MKIAIYYTHSETLGHSCRIKKISEFLASGGHEVLVLQGGIPQPFLEFQGVEVVNIPHPLYGRDRFYTESKKMLDYSLVKIRKDIIKENILRFRPDILFTEYFPFGRTEGKYELYPILDFVKKRFKETKLCASIGYPIFGDIISRKIIRFSRIYDKIFIHTPLIEKHYAERFFSDSNIYKEVFQSLKDKIVFTGYITNKCCKKPTIKDLGKRKLVAVSRGGGVLYPKMISAPMILAEEFNDLFFFITAGPATTDKQWSVFREMSKGIENVKLMRYAPDFQGVIQSSQLSINMAGYNTSVELLLGKNKSIVIPLIFEAEQTYRARLLHDLLGASVLSYKKLNLNAVREKICYQLDLDVKPKINEKWFNGLETLQKEIELW